MKKKKFSVMILLFVFPFSLAFSEDYPVIPENARLDRLKPPTGKIRMVLDTDNYNEIDDQFALVYALLSKEKLDVEAVYAAPFFNSRSTGPGDGMEKSYLQILKILKMMDVSSENFVYRGSIDYLRDVNKPHRSEAALDLIRRAKASSPENPLYVVPIGAITNIASAILIEPEIIRNIVVVWLGGNSYYWPHTREFNLRQDVLASRVVFDCGVPLVQMPCRPVVSHLHTTIPELNLYLKGKNDIADYLYEIVVDYSGGKTAYSKVIWDVSAVAWLVNSKWVATDLIHSPVLTDQVTWSFDTSRHFIRIATELRRDAIFKDMFEKIAEFQ
jgi:inosine-uridine nucleoside N-ribohydrolase